MVGITQNLLARRGGGILHFFFRVLIYDMIITGIAVGLGVSRMVAWVIFFVGLIVLSVAGYIIRQKASPGVDE